MVKAVFFDIDGTLVSMITHEMPDSTLAALWKLKEQGVKLCIASGRPPVQLPLIGERFNAFPFDGYVMLNGQYGMNEKKEELFKKRIDPRALETLVPWLREQDFSVTFMELDYSYDTKFNEGFYAYLKSIGKEDQMMDTVDPERALTHDTYQVCPYIPEERDEEFLRHAPGMKSARWTAEFADMIPADGGKPEGMKKMLEYWGIDIADTMAFGDGGNDATMLEAAGIGVAMGNARDEVKARADYVTDDCEKDGIAKALVHFGLIDRL